MRKLFDFSKLLEGSSMNAEEAYSVATYNEVVTQEIILKRFISNYFSLVMDLNDDELKSIDDILKYYEEKQFFVKVINKEGYPGLVGSYLFISWKR